MEFTCQICGKTIKEYEPPETWNYRDRKTLEVMKVHAHYSCICDLIRQHERGIIAEYERKKGMRFEI